MRHYVITGHARFSEGMASAVKLILGKKIPFVNAYVEGSEDYLEQVKAEIEKHSKHEDVIVLTDVLGGSVNNEMMKIAEQAKVHLVCGVNLAFVIQLLLADENRRVEEVIQETIEEAKEGLQYCNTLIASEELDEF
ncbi:MAG: PTS fructose transporter subunit IIA [Lachnospiraceae bacterium]|nr:PTS fructose transporter subunit IIA [Lachnospiraceae bacterium]